MGNSSSRYSPGYPLPPPQYGPAPPYGEPYSSSKGWGWGPFKSNKKRREQELRDLWFSGRTLWQYPPVTQPGQMAIQPLPANTAAMMMTANAGLISGTNAQMPVLNPALPGASIFPDYRPSTYRSRHRTRAPHYRSSRHRRRRDRSPSSFSDDSDTVSTYDDSGSSDYYSRHHDYYPRRHGRSYSSSHGHNPLPRPPKDVLASTPYRSILAQLPSVQAEFWRNGGAPVPERRSHRRTPTYPETHREERRRDGWFRSLRRRDRNFALSAFANFMPGGRTGYEMPIPEPQVADPSSHPPDPPAPLVMPQMSEQRARHVSISTPVQPGGMRMPSPGPGGPMRMPSPSPGGGSRMPGTPAPNLAHRRQTPGPGVGGMRMPSPSPSVYPTPGGMSVPQPGGMPVPQPGAYTVPPTGTYTAQPAHYTAQPAHYTAQPAHYTAQPASTYPGQQASPYPSVQPGVVPMPSPGRPSMPMPSPGRGPVPMPSPGRGPMSMPSPGRSMNMPMGASGSMPMPSPGRGPGMPMPSPSVIPMAMPSPGGGSGQVVRFSGYGQYAGFLHHSPHNILYDDELYPTALHLFEALKFLNHRPDIAERIRDCQRAEEVYAISSSMAEYARPDWHSVAIGIMDDVLHHKFRQHGDLRSLLLGTGNADLIYAEPNDMFWGEGVGGSGANELGKALMRVRERLRREANR